MDRDTSQIPRFLAYPAGNISQLGLPGALALLDNAHAQWWFYVGLLMDRSNRLHSFELSFIDTALFNLTIVDFDFSFEIDGGAESGGRSFHATSTSGGSRLEALFNMLGHLRVLSTNGSFDLTVSSIQPGGPSAKVTYNLHDRTQAPSMYLGYLGQPGARYDLDAKGRTFLTQYPSAASSKPALYAYEISLSMVDERGLVSEGWGGYSGIDLAELLAGLKEPPPSTNVSVEYAMPRLSVKSWTG